MISIIRQYKLQSTIFTVLCALLAAFMLASPTVFLSRRIYIAYMSTIPFSAILALGLTFIIIAREMDLSFPSVMAFSGFLFTDIFLKTDSPLLALIAALLSGMLAGFINGVIIVKIGVPSMIATIGTQFFWRGVTTLLCDGLSRNIVSIRGGWLHTLMVGHIGGVIPAQAVWTLGLAAWLGLLLNRHPFGDSVRFLGDNVETARMMGIRVERTRFLLFMQMGVLAALSSVMICLEMANWWPTSGEGYLLVVFASIFIGGTSVFGGDGTIFGTCIGAIIIGIIEAGIVSAGLSGFWTRLVYGVIVVISVSFYTLINKKKTVSI